MSRERLARSRPHEGVSGRAGAPEAAPRRAGPHGALPTGTVTFVLADIEGSVRLWETDRAAMASALVRFGALVSQMVGAHRGVRPEEQGEGDSFVAAFAVAGDAVSFVLELQRELCSAPWAAVLPLRVRAAVHTGTAELRDESNYMGSAVNRCARLRALAHGGQVLLSRATIELVADDLERLDPPATVADLGSHLLRDFERAEQVFQLRHPDLPSDFPPLRDGVGHQALLPATPTSFVARTAELAKVAELLAGSRLVTLTGAGGSGKTRLALEHARRAGSDFPDGVAWGDAAPIGEPALVSSVIAAALGIREVASEPLTETIVREVGEGRVLLVIDNCEHVIDEVARVCETLVSGCGALRILATSREAIGLPGEASMRVPALDGDASVALFTDRAQAVRPEFALTDEVASTVRDVCLRLDGIPLAIELAAARVRMLAPQQIADGLADRFRLLTGGARTALPRQRTLEASVDWSYRLLTVAEQKLLDRLAVFAGGFTLDAARFVCADDEVPEGAVLDLLTALDDKSLVQPDGGPDARETRYRMLETIRHFARGRLADATEVDAVRDRHLAHFMALAGELGPKVERGDELVWLARLDRDLDNLRAALDWAEQSGDTDTFLELAAALWLYWEVRCRFDEGCSRLRRAIAATTTTTPTRARAMALYGLGDMSIFMLDLAQVASSGEELVIIGTELDDPVVIARGTTLLGWASCFGAFRDPEWAVTELAKTLAALQAEEDDPWLYGDASMALGCAHIGAGELASAGRSFDVALDSETARRSYGGLQRATFMRGWCHVLAGEVQSAIPMLERAVELADDLDDTFWRAVALGNLGAASLLAGNPGAAEAAAGEALAMAERFGNPIGVAFASEVLIRTAAGRGDIELAVSILDPLKPTVDAISAAWLSASTSGLAALLTAWGGDASAARTQLGDALRAAGARPYPRALASAYRGWAELAMGDDAAAETAWSDAIAAASQASSPVLVAFALEELAAAAARRDQPERAVRLDAAARSQREALGVVPARWARVPAPDAAIASAEGALGGDVTEGERQAGRSLSLQEAVTFALRGKGGRRRPSTGWESLTPMERDVVRLVSDGLTNPAIAERLLVTRGTVKVHLSHIFAKLGVTSRAELAASAVRRAD